MRISRLNGSGVALDMGRMARWGPLVLQIGVIVLSLTFAVAAITKSVEFDQLSQAITATHLLPEAASPPSALLVVALEYCVAVGVWVHPCRRWAAGASCGLCWVFLWYHAWTWIDHVPVPCHCFGPLFQMPALVGLAVDACLLAVSAAVLNASPAPRDVQRGCGAPVRLPMPPAQPARDRCADPDFAAWSVFKGIALLSAAGLVGTGVLYVSKSDTRGGAPPPTLVNAAAAAVIGPAVDFRGDARSPYTLVEFGDYECPPCRAVAPLLRTLLSRYGGRLRLTFRNLPLKGMHPLAMDAAVAAEAAREQGKFWPMHDGLYSARPDSARISSLERTLGLDMVCLRKAESGSALRAVTMDERQAAALGVQATPSFLLCCPDGRVLRLDSLDQLRGALLAGPAAAARRGGV